MANELSKIDSEAAKFLAVAQDIQTAANPRLIKFIKGDYFIGEENVTGKLTSPTSHSWPGGALNSAAVNALNGASAKLKMGSQSPLVPNLAISTRANGKRIALAIRVILG